jgi:predicted HNH restriction endonuclease
MMMTNDGFNNAPHNPPWTRDELILALDLYVRFKGNPPGKSSPEIIDLSALLNRIVGSARGTDFRNSNGVYMKLMNFRRFDPVYQQQGKRGLTRGNKLEDEVWNYLSGDPARLTDIAKAIRATIEQGPTSFLDTEHGDLEEAEEGRVLTRAHLTRERSRKLVEAKKASVLRSTGALACEACSFDFKAKYGERGVGFIEVHHAVPLHLLEPGARTKLDDLHLLCANCHRMVHSRRPWLTMDQLKACLRT